MAFKLHYRLHAADGRSVFFDLRKPVTLKLCEGEGEDGEGVGMFNWWTLSSTMKRGWDVQLVDFEFCDAEGAVVRGS